MNALYLNYAINSLKVCLLFSIVTLSFFVARSSLMAHSEMASAITFDLTLTLPILYSIFIRKTRISKLTVIPVFIFGVIFASIILPAGNTRFLDLIKFFALPAVELGVFGYAGFIVYKSRKTFQKLRANRNDFMENLRETLAGEFPVRAAANALTFEIAVFYHAFVGWKTKRGDRFYTYHKKSGVFALMSVLFFLVAVETAVLHFLIAGWNGAVAWVLTVLSIYFLFQLFAHGKAIFLRPIEINDEKLFIRCGLFGDSAIDLKNIEKIEITTQSTEPEKDAVTLSALGKFTTPNLKISLRESEILNGIYGRRRNYKTIFLFVDEPELFKAEIEKYEKGE